MYDAPGNDGVANARFFQKKFVKAEFLPIFALIYP